MFDPVRICEILNEEGVEYVVLGGFAAVAHGSSLPTRDIDVIPARTTENLDRLAKALWRVDARIRTDGEPVATAIDGPFLANMPFMLNLVTQFGEMDLTFAPAGALSGFEGWARSAVMVDIGGGVRARIAALDDIIASKMAADRPKDQLALPYLESLRDQIELAKASGESTPDAADPDALSED